MTEKQKKYIKYLDNLCKQRKLSIRATDEDMLDYDWEEFYKNITPDYASEVINRLKSALGMEIKELKGGNKR